MRSWVALAQCRSWIIAWLLVALALVAPVAGADERYIRDELGRTLRVSFDPGSRLLLGAGFAPVVELDGEERARSYLEVGTAHRQLVDFDGEGISYKLYQQALWSRAFLGERLELDATAYRVLLSRWTEDGRIVLPTSPPRRVSFPLNIGFEAEVGHARMRELPRGYDATIGVLRADVILDPWRRRRLRSYAHLGVGPRYDVELSRRDDTAVSHLVAPFTAGSLALHHESAGGHHAFDLGAEGGYRLRVTEGFRGFATAGVSYEAILVAVNDAPVSAFASGRYQYDQHGERHSFGAFVGLRASIPVTW